MTKFVISTVEDSYLSPLEISRPSLRGYTLNLKATNRVIVGESGHEVDGRWIAEVPELPGVLAYGATPKEAIAQASALVFRLMADEAESQALAPPSISQIESKNNHLDLRFTYNESCPLQSQAPL